VALAIMNVALVFGKAELDVASSHFLAAYAGSRSWALARGFARWSRRVILGTSLAAAGVGALLIVGLRDVIVRRSPDLPAALFAACVLLVLSAQLMLNAGQLQAFKQYIASQWPGTVLRPLLVAGTIATVYFLLGGHPDPSLAMLANIAATTVAVLITANSLRRARPTEIREASPRVEPARWSRAAGGFVAIGLGQLILSQQTDLIVIGSIVGVSDAALYGVASQVAVLVIFGQTSVSFVTAPMIAELYARGDHDGLQKLLNSIMKANALVVLPVLAGLIVFGAWLLRLYQPVYAEAYPVMLVLALSAGVVGFVGATAGFLLTMTAYQREAAWIVGSSAATNLALTLILTPRFGIMGTAVATFIATMLRGVLLSVVVYRRLGLSVVPGQRHNR
jgi:O-antigen/teichoic acid export membrane protein